MKLLERYSLQTGLKIGKQFLMEKFYPLEANTYITIQAGSGMQGKNYPFFNEVLDVLAETFKQNNIKIYQLGGPEDPPLKHCIHLQGKLDIHQSNYVLSRAALHIGNDSWLQHRAGHLNIPIIDLFGTTSEKNHSPLNYNPNSIFLSSHRWNKTPTFASNENPLSIALIPPEQIINSVFKIFQANFSLPRKSFLFGGNYLQSIVEWVPDQPLNVQLLNGPQIVVRFDYLKNGFLEVAKGEQFLYQVLSQRNCIIVTNHPLNIDVLKRFKQNITFIALKISDAISISYAKELKQSGIRCRFVTEEKDEEKIKKIRLDLFDVTLVEKINKKSKQNFLNEAKEYSNSSLEKINIDNLHFRTNKYIISNNKIFLSQSHFYKDISTPSFDSNIGKVIDDDLFWEEIDHFYFFTP
jgi:hypothetical protein